MLLQALLMSAAMLIGQCRFLVSLVAMLIHSNPQSSHIDAAERALRVAARYTVSGVRRSNASVYNYKDGCNDALRHAVGDHGVRAESAAHRIDQ